ncbi:recombinase family protein [Isoptericola cucumis]|uniref:recombinase family protein n=1 Tax=Isoptericola cucumis TaxID=1776856 RepID=UPI003208A2A6
MTVRAAIYTRISQDRESREAGIDRQETDCQALAERLGYEVVAVFRENDIGASTKSRKPRPLYAELIDGARTGRWDVIVAYSSSRLTRRPRESEDLIDLFERHGTQFAYVVSSRFDLSTADGRMQSRIAASIDAGEAERIAERVVRAKQEAAEQGKFRGGPRVYGFEVDGVTLRPAEAEVVREMTHAVLAGRTLRALSAEMNDRGLKTARGNDWNPNRLRDMLLRPRNAGLLHHGRAARGEVSIVGAGQWPAIVDQDTWRAVYGLLRDPSRLRPKGHTDGRWLGSGIYRCGRCGAPMRVVSSSSTSSRASRPFYRCEAKAHLQIDQHQIDKQVKDAVVELVRDPRVLAQMTPGTDDEALAADRERRAVLAARLEGFEADYAAGHITGAQLAKATDRVTLELADVDGRLADAARRSVSSPVLSALDPGEAFLHAPLDIRRAVLRAVLQVEVHKATKFGGVWDPRRVHLTPVGADTEPAEQVPGAPADLVRRAQDYIAIGDWTFAKTMPENPHWYTVRQRAWAVDEATGQGHEALFELIREHPTKRRFQGKSYRSITLDGFVYWIIRDGMIINRKPADQAGWDADA